MKAKCIISAPTAEALTMLINEYYHSENYEVRGSMVYNRKTGKYLDGVYVCQKGGRWQMRREENDHHA